MTRRTYRPARPTQRQIVATNRETGETAQLTVHRQPKPGSRWYVHLEGQWVALAKLLAGKYKQSVIFLPIS